MKGSSHPKDLTTVKIYIPNIGKPIYIKQVLTDVKAKIDGNAGMVGNFNTSHSTGHSERKSVKR